MVFAVAALFVLGRTLLPVSGVAPDLAQSLGGGMTFLYAIFVSLLIGASASAEERVLGVEWQLLQPVAVWKQWTLKVATALLLAFALAVALPALVEHASPLFATASPTRIGGIGRIVWQLSAFGNLGQAAGIMACVCGALFVSSLSSSGLRALLVTFPLISGIAVVSTAISRAANAAVMNMPAIRDLSQAVSSGRVRISYGAWWWWMEVMLPSLLRSSWPACSCCF